MSLRIQNLFQTLKAQNKTAFIAYIMSGDPNQEISQDFLTQLPEAGVDMIELGVPFSDPMADGPVIEAAGLRARAADTTLSSILDMVRQFRQTNQTTPLILMGYCNPVHYMGYTRFAQKAKDAGVDGTIIVDLPPEEDHILRSAFETHDLALIRLATPTTDTQRLSIIAKAARGFVYYVSMTGVTGAALGTTHPIAAQVTRIRQATHLPVVVGFGIKTPAHARRIAPHADGVVVGTAIVQTLHEKGLSAALTLVKKLADAIHHPAPN